MTSRALPEPVHVAAAALVDDRGRVLLARRPDHVHKGGLWEFPGGKLERGETVAQGLHRELHEELGISVRRHRPLIQVRHAYPEREVLLDVHLVTAWDGEAHGREGQPLAWVEPTRISEYPMPEADVPIVTALELPDTYLITLPDARDPQVFMRHLQHGLSRGATLVQFRVFGLDEATLLALGRQCLARCREAGARMLVNADPVLAARLGADGVHFGSRQLLAGEPAAETAGLLRAVSVHDPAQLARAEAAGMDFCVLSPVLPTPSHPDAEPLGWECFGDWVAAARVPVYALGGMRAAMREQAWQHGGQGVAGIRGLYADA